MLQDVDTIRKLFPALAQRVYDKPLVYLDNSATTQKPEEVLKTLSVMNSMVNGNIHRAVHYLSARCTERYEEARQKVARYIHAAQTKEVIFTSGATASLNLLAFSFGQTYVRPGDHIIITNTEHHSNLVPWQMLCERTGAVLDVWRAEPDGRLELEKLRDLLEHKPHVKLLAVAHVSNVLGLVNPIKEITALAHTYGVPVLVDGAQGIVHGSVDVQALDVDFYAFSGHKMYGPTGTGVLYGKAHFLEEMVPWQGGGDMIASVSLEHGTTYAALPMKFEAGTANYIGASALGAAVDFMESIDRAWFIQHEQELVGRGLDALNRIPGLHLYGWSPAATSAQRVPLFSFTVDGAHPNDMAILLDQMGIAVRSGQLCAEPLLASFGATAVLRASFGVYNTVQELDYFVKCLQRAIDMLR